MAPLDNGLPTDYQAFIHTSRYARWIEDEGRRETWPETVDRYCSNVIPLVGEECTAISDAIQNLEVMPSMRAMMTAGPALDRTATAGYNCSFLPVDSPRSFDETMFILLCGTGVGFSVERQYTDQLPTVPGSFECVVLRRVQDSKEGWASALREHMAILWSGAIPEWDFSAVRPAGAKLKTFGGRASGPGPLKELFDFITAQFVRAQGRKLTPIECHDIMCKIGEVVVVGGVRRSAMISLSDLGDKEMAAAKSGEWWKTHPHRALANNSAVYLGKPSRAIFDEEWASLIASYSGERGIFNREASQNVARRTGRRDSDHEFGTNPCCVSGDTPILTGEGYRCIEETVGQHITVWNGEGWAPVTPYEAGVGELVRVHLSDGTHLDCTPNHRFVLDGIGFIEVADLRPGDRLAKFDMPVVWQGEEYPGDAYSQGFYSADGTKGQSRSWVYAPKYCAISRLSGTVQPEKNYARRSWVHGPMLDKAFVPTNGSGGYCLNWLAGVLDGDGSVVRHPNSMSIHLASIDHAFLADIRLMLTRFGVQAKIGVMHPDQPERLFDGYPCQACYRLLINATDVAHLIGLGLKTSRLELGECNLPLDARRFVTVDRIEDLDRFEMTYCFTEPETGRGTFNGIVTGNSEIILRPYQFCNLSEVVIRPWDDWYSLAEKVRLATIIGTAQSTLTHFSYLRDIWRETTEEERLLGVSLTGIMDNPLTRSRYGLADGLTRLRNVAIETNAEYADKLGIPRSTSITCVKPSGTVSQLVDSASGIHARHSDFYIRTVRGDVKDPLTQFMIAQGIPSEPCMRKPDTTVVFSFPQKAPSGAVTRDECTAVGELELWLLYQRHWCEHKPSVTISVRDDEWGIVGDWVYDHFDEVSGVSFLPYDGGSYVQAPYQECSEDQYHGALEKMPRAIDWAGLEGFEKEDMTKSMQTFACTGDFCELVDI